MTEFITALENKISSMRQQGPFIAKVVTAPPNITLEYLGQIIPTAQIKVMNNLLQEYHRTFRDSEEKNFSEIKQNYSASDESLSGEGPHKHNFISSTSTGTSKNTSEGGIWFTDTLRIGCEVLVQPVLNSYVVVGQVVQMPSGAKEGA